MVKFLEQNKIIEVNQAGFTTDMRNIAKGGVLNSLHWEYTALQLIWSTAKKEQCVHCAAIELDSAFVMNP